MFSGDLPGYEFGVERVREVLGGEVKRTFSLGRGTKPLLASSITQLRSLSLAYYWYICYALAMPSYYSVWDFKYVC